MNNPNSPTDAGAPARAYALGHSDGELDRLAVQARLIDPITRGFFPDAGSFLDCVCLMLVAVPAMSPS
jgi:hypothetical protein